MINILIVDERRLFSEGIVAFLSDEENITIVGRVETCLELQTLLSENNVHVVLINVSLQLVDGLDVTMCIRKHHPNVKIIHYTAESDDELIIKSIYSGADCIILETVQPEYFIHSINAVVAGEVFFSGEVAKILAERVLDFQFDEKVKLQRKTRRLNLHLTQRELDVAVLLKKNYTNREIAQKLRLSEGTVKNYVSQLYRSFEISNRNELISYINKL